MFKSRARKFADMFSTSLKDVLEGGDLDKTAVEGFTAVEAKANAVEVKATAVEAKANANSTALSSLHTVATSGAYSDLTGTPNLHSVATSGDFNDLLNQPAPFDPTTLATVATTGSFNDLSDQPAPFDPTTLATVATTGSYTDLSNKPEAFPSGTKMLFQQTAAPTGWTKDTTHNNKALRVVSGTAGSGGTQNFTTAFSSRSTNSVATSGTVGNKTLTQTHMPSHRHYTVYNGARQYSSQYGTTLSTSRSTAQRAHAIGYESYTLNAHSSNANVSRTNASGSSGAHNHSFTGSSHSHTLDMAVQYVDLIIATKD